MAQAAKRQALRLVCNNLEKLIQKDPGNRGIHHLHQQGELFNCVSHLIDCSHVGVSTGFPCTKYNPPTESDGIGGVMILAYSLLKQNPSRNVTLFYDEIHNTVMLPLIKDFNKLHDISDSNQRFKVAICHDTGISCQDLLSTNNSTIISRFMENTFLHPKKVDHLIAVELSSYNQLYRFKTMKNNDITDKCSFSSHIFDYAFKNNICQTSGIGDGGNEAGMGKYRLNVEKYINNGKDIASIVETHNGITAGVSNWGAEAISVALHAWSSIIDDNNENNVNFGEQLYCDEEFHEQMYKLTGKYGAADPLADSFDGSVDGMPYDYHLQMWRDLCKIADETRV